MQLFRQQALDYRNRLHGDVLFVPPSRWLPIGVLLLVAVAAASLLLFFGSSSRTVMASGTLRSASPDNGNAGTDDGWRLDLKVPAAIASSIAPGQEVRVTLADYPVSEYGSLRGMVEHVEATPTEKTSPNLRVIARLDALTNLQRSRDVMLRPGLTANARIVIGERSLLQELTEALPAPRNP